MCTRSVCLYAGAHSGRGFLSPVFSRRDINTPTQKTNHEQVTTQAISARSEHHVLRRGINYNCVWDLEKPGNPALESSAPPLSLPRFQMLRGSHFKYLTDVFSAQ